jgi:GNAT superfamily N-acetyltransferase
MEVMKMNNLEYYVSADKSKLNIEAIKLLLKQSYWANERTEETIAKSVENSICYGVYKNDELVGFGRVVTDYSTVYWICDIIIDVKHRGNGLGKKLMENIMSTKELSRMLGILATKDAHGLYEHYGFCKEPHKFMAKLRMAK